MKRGGLETIWGVLQTFLEIRAIAFARSDIPENSVKIPPKYPRVPCGGRAIITREKREILRFRQARGFFAHFDTWRSFFV